MGPGSIWAVAVGSIIGWGCFIQGGLWTERAGGTLPLFLGFLAGGLLMIVVGYSYSYMIAKFPVAGGEFAYAYKGFGRTASYICGWMLSLGYLSIVALNATALPVLASYIFPGVFNRGYLYTIAGYDVYMGEVGLSLFFIILFGIMNYKGAKSVGNLQLIMVLIMCAAVVVSVAGVVVTGHFDVTNLQPAYGAEGKTLGGGFVSILALAPFLYVGFDCIPQAAEEYKFSPTKASFIMIVAISFGCFVYIANNTITAAALANWPDLIINSSHTPWLLLAASERLLGVFGKVIVGIAVFSAVLTGIMGFYMASSRLIYSMARDGYLPESFAVIDPKHRTPKNALLFCIGISLSGPILGREALGWFVDMCAIGASIGFLFTCLATRVTMKKNGESNSFLSIVSVLGAAFSAFFIALQLIPIPGLDFVHFGTPSYLLLVVWILIGAAFYLGRFGLKAR